MPQSIPKAVLQINNARQILALVKERPCVNKTGTTSQRGTIIAYAELTTVEKLLNDAVRALVPTVPVKFEGGVDADDNFVRPMGAPSLHSELEQAVINHLRDRPMTASQLASELANISPSATEAVLVNMANKRLVWRDDRKVWSLL